MRWRSMRSSLGGKPIRSQSRLSRRGGRSGNAPDRRRRAAAKEPSSRALAGEWGWRTKDQLADVRKAPRFFRGRFLFRQERRSASTRVSHHCSSWARQESYGDTFVPSETQRAFAAAAAGVGVPKKLICRL